MPGQLYKLDSCYGNEQQLKELLTKLRDSGIEPLADIVINHRSADICHRQGGCREPAYTCALRGWKPTAACNQQCRYTQWQLARQSSVEFSLLSIPGSSELCKA